MAREPSCGVSALETGNSSHAPFPACLLRGQGRNRGLQRWVCSEASNTRQISRALHWGKTRSRTGHWLLTTATRDLVELEFHRSHNSVVQPNLHPGQCQYTDRSTNPFANCCARATSIVATFCGSLDFRVTRTYHPLMSSCPCCRCCLLFSAAQAALV